MVTKKDLTSPETGDASPREPDPTAPSLKRIADDIEEALLQLSWAESEATEEGVPTDRSRRIWSLKTELLGVVAEIRAL
jgi:hypothetical protein